MIICVDHRKVKNLTCRHLFLMNSSKQLTLNIEQNPSNCREKIFPFVIVSSYNMFATAGQLFPKINLIELFDMYLSMKIQSLIIMKNPTSLRKYHFDFYLFYHIYCILIPKYNFSFYPYGISYIDGKQFFIEAKINFLCLCIYLNKVWRMETA